MADLNDYIYFAEVVAHGGFAPAGRALRQPKSKLSRRVAGLEARLGVRLIERSTRRFRVTVVAQAQAEPYGRVRFSCPTGLFEALSSSLPGFLSRYPKVHLQVVAINRAVDLIAERIDVALRIRAALTSDAALTVRSLGRTRRILVASPAFVNRVGADIAGLASLPTLSTNDDSGEIEWHLEGPDGAERAIPHEPRMTCGDFAAVRVAAAAGMGVAFLPEYSCRDALASGSLVRLLPDWRGRAGIVHLVFTTRRGLPPAVRALIDHLVATFPADALET
jgi:DNA-binding transcriptional LysR family regulator